MSPRTPASKYKGSVDGHHPRHGLGRLRRAHAQDTGRQSGWERLADDDHAADRIAAVQKRSHAGENLLARFNRLADRGVLPGVPAEICGFRGRCVVVRMGDGTERQATIREALKKRVSGVKNPLCIGDAVHVALEGTGAVVVACLPRRTQLARADSHNRSLIHVFAANVDRLLVVAALRSPDIKAGLIDRYLLIAAWNGIQATLVLNKCDLAEGAVMAGLYRSLGIPVFVTDCLAGGGDLESLRSHVSGQACVVAGQSGVGKSSLLNRLDPTIQARTGTVAEAGFGRHTTTAAVSYPLPGGGRLLDTPGIRECAITGMEALDVALLMPDLATHHPMCRFADCSHLHEPDCAVRAAVAAGAIAASRYESYRSIVLEDLA